jgi:hypothetical protein
MGGSLIADNWSLQNIAELFAAGVDDSSAAAISANKAADTHAYESLPQAAISFEALFDFITDIVLRDQLLVDQRFTSTWTKFDTNLGKLADANVIRPFEFLAQADKLAGPRNEFVERLCLTGSIRAAHQRNSQEWARARETPDRTLSATLWGGAGMLARAFISEKGYTPHPLRRRLFQRAGIVLPHEDAAARLVGTIQEKRASISKSMSGSDAMYALRLNLPPLPVIVIREASNASQLLTVALQLRSEYQDLRNWLGEYQQALTSSDSSSWTRFEKTLRSISTYIESLRGIGDSNAPTFTAGFGVLKVAFRGHPVEFMKNQFGVRATVNRLILAGSGLEELKRLLGFFDHRHSEIAVKLIDHFRTKDQQGA